MFFARGYCPFFAGAKSPTNISELEYRRETNSSLADFMSDFAPVRGEAGREARLHSWVAGLIPASWCALMAVNARNDWSRQSCASLLEQLKVAETHISISPLMEVRKS